jgi:predicted DNA-binding transcriptional regulator YafY
MPEIVPVCRWVLGNRVKIGPTGPDGRVEVELRGHNVHSLAGEIAGLGRGLEIVEPAELRQRLGEIAAELVALYR